MNEPLARDRASLREVTLMVSFAKSVAAIWVLAQEFPILAVIWLIGVALIGVGLTLAGWAIDPTVLLISALMLTVIATTAWVYCQTLRGRNYGRR